MVSETMSIGKFTDVVCVYVSGAANCAALVVESEVVICMSVEESVVKVLYVACGTSLVASSGGEVVTDIGSDHEV